MPNSTRSEGRAGWVRPEPERDCGGTQNWSRSDSTFTRSPAPADRGSGEGSRAPDGSPVADHPSQHSRPLALQLSDDHHHALPTNLGQDPHFGRFAERVSDKIKEHARQFAEKHGRPFHYLQSSSLSKENYARTIMEQDGIHRGLVCVLSCVEPCQTYALRRDRESKRLVLTPARRKCLFLYFYFVDREFGLMHVRLQTWLPMSIQVCLNGREYLARRLDKAGIGYEKRGNCFTRIDDLPRAQRMIDALNQRNWAHFLNAFARRLNPWLDGRNGLEMRGYYWSIRESEYATDVMFADEASLRAVYPSLVNHAVQHFGCRDVMRFLGRRFHRDFNGEVTSNVKHRPEGVRVKHWVEENSIKMYDKQGSVLRIETTINNPRRFNIRRKATRHGQFATAWFPMRLHSRTSLCN